MSLPLSPSAPTQSAPLLFGERLTRLAVHWRHPALHLSLIAVGYRLAYELRYDFALPPDAADLFWISLPLLVILRLVIYAVAGVFRADWFHFNHQDLLTLAVAATLSSAAFVLALLLGHLFSEVPPSVLLVDWATAVFLAGGVPLIARSLREAPKPKSKSVPTPHHEIEHLLPRTSVDLDLSPVAADLRNRVVLLTGAAGSIGSELARQIARFGPARLVLVDQAESDLYFVHLELSEAYPSLNPVPVICDITSATRLAQVFAQHRPDLVVHAAAYKHVPLMEANVLEAVRNNVLGTLLVATTAVRYGAKKVLLVSSDKAIRPSSVMGATKRVAERIVFGLPNLHRSGTDFRVVRFGNVLASKGSVIALFQRQLAAGSPLTVTHPLAQRYFMTIPEAAQLVLLAGALPETAGAIAMLEIGEPVRILDLAEKLIRLSGRGRGKDVSISFIGLRPGEKLTEDQVSAREETVRTSGEKIRISQPAESAGPELVQQLSRLFAHMDQGDGEGVLATLCELVPECVLPLRARRRELVSLNDSPYSGPLSGAWHGVMDSGQRPRRDRRRADTRVPPVADPPVAERRQGAACRRKEARAGGRRRTDAGALLPEARPPRWDRSRLNDSEDSSQIVGDGPQ